MSQECLICKNHLYNHLNNICSELGTLLLEHPFNWWMSLEKNGSRIRELIEQAKFIRKEIDKIKNDEHTEIVA